MAIAGESMGRRTFLEQSFQGKNLFFFFLQTCIIEVFFFTIVKICIICNL